MADDENLELKKRSRRRLVGAAALALLAVIVLPMVMDDEPGVPVQDIQVTIPDRNADSALARPIAGRPEADAVVAPPPQEQPPVSATTVRPTPDEPRPRSESPGPQGERPATDKGGAIARPSPASVTPPSGQDEAARVQALLEGKAAASAAREQPFVVQVGAFSEKAKAVAISGDLKGRGFSAYIEDAGAVTRVRVGPYATREDAEKAAARLGALGINGVISSR
ncbi:MAG: SPOR domain-containing protein [Rhodocyclales bacterium]|nr:SPOR domain-containing protein [Rhodocyclales bacterium]